MDIEETKKAAEVMRAYASDKPIEVRSTRYANSTWYPLAGSPSWDWTNYEYRVKREPRVIWATHDNYGRVFAAMTSPPSGGKDGRGNTYRRFVEDLEGSSYD